MEGRRSVYLDYNATTPIHPEVKKKVVESLDIFANASSMHEAGRYAGSLVEEMRGNVASLINAAADDVIFTSGGSESNNAVLKMVLSKPFCDSDKNEIIVSKIEHPCILSTAQYLEKMGITVHFLGVDEKGFVDLDQLETLLSEKTFLVSIMYANNEIGTIQDLKKITEMVHQYDALFHTDAVQAVGKIPVDVKELDIDFLSFSGHKFYGPKGIGGLYIKKGTPFIPLIHGGHQEDGRRAGTINNSGIIGIGNAAKEIKKEMTANAEREQALVAKLKKGITDSIPDIVINSPKENCLPNTLNVSFKGAEGEAILLYLDLEGIHVSTGSACASGSLDPSHVLLATGIDMELAHGSIRFSLGRHSVEEDVDYVLGKLPNIIERIRKMSTAY